MTYDSMVEDGSPRSHTKGLTILIALVITTGAMGYLFGYLPGMDSLFLSSVQVLESESVLGAAPYLVVGTALLFLYLVIRHVRRQNSFKSRY